MKLFIAFFLFLLLANTSVRAATQSNTSEWFNAAQRCNKAFIPSGVPDDDNFRDLRAVGLIVNNLGSAYEKIYPSVFQTRNIVAIFSSRIREQLFRWLIPDENCQIPDVEVFKDVTSNPDRIYLKDFMGEKGRLLVSVQTQFFSSEGVNLFERGPRGAAELARNGAPFAVLTLHLFKSDSLVSGWSGGVGNAFQVVIPLTLPEAEITSRLKRFAENIHVIPPGSVIFDYATTTNTNKPTVPLLPYKY